MAGAVSELLRRLSLSEDRTIVLDIPKENGILTGSDLSAENDPAFLSR
jgi:hypothetical protein